MKKSLLALAILGAFGVAHAQTSVVIDGTIDNSLVRGKSATGAPSLTMASSQRNTNYIGVSGTEDIGGGLKAIFQVRTGFASDSPYTQQAGGTAPVGTSNPVTNGLGDQNAWLGLSGGFGTVKLGKGLNPQYLQVSAYSVFGTGFLNNRASMNVASYDARFSNSVSYTSPTVAGFGAMIMWAPKDDSRNMTLNATGNTFSGYPTSVPTGSPISARVTYGAGPVSVGVAATQNGYTGSSTVWNLGGSYAFSMATIKAQYERDQNLATDKSAYLLAAEGAVPGTALVLKAQFARRQAASLVSTAYQQAGIGADYNLSKRTVAYLFYGEGKTTSAASSSSSTVLGVRHAF